MTDFTVSRDQNRIWLGIRPDNRLLWASVAVLVAAALFLSTLQIHSNSSLHPYTTDVGEVQNALPRWGTLHDSSYPLYSMVGSSFVTVLRLFGVGPAAGTSLYSLLWGLVTVALLVILAMELGVAGPFAAMGGLAAAVSTSIWIDSSLAEIHTMSSALTVATLWLALRFGQSGTQRDLLWLTLAFSQGVFHQRAILLIAPAVLLLVWPHLMSLFRMGWRSWARVLGVALLAPLVYLYLPLRVWTGADWVFGSPGTWDGFWEIMFFNTAGRVYDLQAGWLTQVSKVLSVLHQDLWLPLIAIGLAGLWFSPPRAAADGNRPHLRISLAFSSVWLAYFLVTIPIWEGRISDALLAAKLPVVLMAGLGLALWLDWLWRRSVPVGWGAAIILMVALAFRVVPTRSFILEITRDQSTQVLVDTVGRFDPATGGRPATLVVPWGTDYWTLTYAQGFENKLSGLRLVDHNARPRDIISRGERLLAIDQTFYVFPPAYYEERLGPLYLAAAAPGVFEMSPEPIIDPATSFAELGITPIDFDLQNGIAIIGVHSAWVSENELQLTVYYRAGDEPPGRDYSVAVHLVAHDPPRGEADILDQDDHSHPVGGWYPTSRWRAGEVVRDVYLLRNPDGTAPVAARIAMYYADPEAGFVNTPWLSVSLPDQP